MPDKVREKIPNTLTPNNTTVFGRIVDILEDARGHVARMVNGTMVVAYWLIGREIVEEGPKRADHGKTLIENLSKRLTQRYGKDFSTVSLCNMRKFYQTCIGRSSAIISPLGRELGGGGKLHTRFRDLTPKQRPTDGESKTDSILCTDKNDAVVEYVLDKGNERIFASRYKLEHPPKEELRRLLL